MKTHFTIIAFLTIAINTFAAMRVTQVNEYVTNSPRYYDMDADGDNDFSFTLDFQYYEAFVECSKPTSYIAADGASGNYAKAYVEGAGMGTYHWEPNSGFLFDLDNVDGFFLNTTKYLMVKFSDGTNTYYGWFLLSNSSSNFYIVSYGYNDTPNTTVFPGEGETLGISEADKTKFALAALTAKSVAFNDCSSFDKVMVYTADGKTIAEINRPEALQTYMLNNEHRNVLLIAYFRKQQLLYTARHLARD